MSSGLFTEVPPGAALLLTAVLAIPCGIVIASMLKSHKAKADCEIAAVEWEAGNVNGAAYRPSGAVYFAKQYDIFRTAYPDGHVLVNDSKLPEAVRAGYVSKK